MPTLRLVADVPADHGVPTPDLAVLGTLFADPTPLAGLDGNGLAALLRELSFAVVDLARAERDRVVIPTEASEPMRITRPRAGAVWEVGLKRDGSRLLVSLFKQGPEPMVAQTEHPVSITAAREALLGGILALPEDDGGLTLARQALLEAATVTPAAATECVRVEIHSTGRARLHFCATTALRRCGAAQPTEVAQADLHSLLFRGAFRVSIGNSERQLRDVHLYLLAEQLVELARDVVGAQRRGRGMLRRVEVGGSTVGIQVDGRGHTTLLVGVGGPGATAGWRLPPVPGKDFCKAVVSFGRRLLKQLCDVDRSQRDNLRLVAYRRALREVSASLRGTSEGPPKLNAAPESYRAFAESDTRPPPAVAGPPRPLGNLRFRESWRADVPAIDLRSIFLRGEGLIVGSARELACIERSSGQVVWTRHTRRAVSVLTPVGVARLAADGQLAIHDFEDGDLVFELGLAPCVGASTSGAVVNAPGLPHMLVVGDGARHLAAVDLDSGGLRWRRAVGTRLGAEGRRLRLRRAGKLLIVASGDSSLSALDLLTGEVVWRHCGGRRYGAVSVDGGSIFALAVESTRGASRFTVEQIDPWTGAVGWRSEGPRAAQISSAPLAASERVLLTTRDDGGRTGVIGLCRATGAVCYDLPAGLCVGAAGCLVVDDLLVANSESGELCALAVADGSTRYRHVFAGWSSRFHPADRPKSMQPVLRSGALFLPQTEVYVVRPHDGAMLGRLPAELIPDALRVDERCSVYVAESSGYMAAYDAQPTLTLVRPL